MPDVRVRIEIAFEGGLVMSAIVQPDTADALERAVAAAGEKAFSIDADDGRYILRLDRLLYLKRYAREGRVGFGA